MVTNFPERQRDGAGITQGVPKHHLLG
jgi:hypothetical protein